MEEGERAVKYFRLRRSKLLKKMMMMMIKLRIQTRDDNFNVRRFKVYFY